MTETNTTGIEMRGNDFVIVRHDERGVRTELVLSETAIVALAQAFPRLLREQLARRQTPLMSQHGIEPILTATVTNAEINEDLHGSLVFLRLQDDLGNWTGYQFPPAYARQIGKRLIARADKLDGAGAQTKQ